MCGCQLHSKCSKCARDRQAAASSQNEAEESDETEDEATAERTTRVSCLPTRYQREVGRPRGGMSHEGCSENRRSVSTCGSQEMTSQIGLTLAAVLLVADTRSAQLFLLLLVEAVNARVRLGGLRQRERTKGESPRIESGHYPTLNRTGERRTPRASSAARRPSCTAQHRGGG